MVPDAADAGRSTCVAREVNTSSTSERRLESRRGKDLELLTPNSVPKVSFPA